MPRFTETPSAEAAAALLAEHVARGLRGALDRQERATLADSGGKSPVAFFHALNQNDSVDWPRVNITLADERLVPTGHDDSNTRLVRAHLLQNQAAAARWLPLVDDAASEGSLKDRAGAVDFALRRFVRPDVLVLGMGADGHTASLFPQSPQLADGIRADYPQPLLYTDPVTAPHGRISLTLAAIERVPAVYLAIAGAEKLAVYRRAERQAGAALPVSLVLNSNKVSPHVFYHA